MEKKKMKLWKKILIAIVIVLVIFVLITARKVIIIKGLQDRIEKYSNINNYYIKFVSTQGQETENYVKGEKYITTLTVTSSEGKVSKLTNYCNGEKINTYIEGGEEKVAILDSEGLPTSAGIISWVRTDNIVQLISMSITSHIKTENCNGKECYKISNFYSNNLLYSEGKNEVYIEKETGLTIKAINGTAVDENGNEQEIISEYEYKFGVVTDDDLKEPDISEYKIQNNNE